MDSVMANRAALGLELRVTGTKRDTLGVFVEAVTPKGPAETAGIIEGDRIAAINGVDLRTSIADTEDSYTNGLASHRLSREVQKLTPGAKVSLRVYSGGRFRDVQVTAGRASDLMRGGRYGFGFPGMGGAMEFNGPEMMKISEPEMRMLREQLPKMREQLEPMMKQEMPLLKQRLEDLPNRIMLRSLPRMRMTAPVRAHRTYRVDRGGGMSVAVAGGGGPGVEHGEVFYFDDTTPEVDESEFDFPGFGEPFMFDMDDEPLDFETEIVPVTTDEVRELVATTARSARVALEQLAADRIA